MKVKPFGVRQSALLHCLSVLFLKRIHTAKSVLRFHSVMTGNLLKCAAHIPLDPLQVSERKVAQGVQSTAEGHTSTCRGPVRMLVIGVKRGVVVEVLLHMNEVDVVLGQQLTNACSVVGLVSRNVIPVDDLWQSGNIERDGVERSCVLGTCKVQKRKQRNDVVERGRHLGLRMEMLETYSHDVLQRHYIRRPRTHAPPRIAPVPRRGCQCRYLHLL